MASGKAGDDAAAMGALGWALLLLLSGLWGGSFFFIALAVEQLPTLTIVFLRVLAAAVALWLFILATHQPIPRAPGVWLAFLCMAMLNNVIPFTFIVWGQASIASGLAAILNATTPLFTALVAGALLADEKLTPQRVAGIAIGFAGVVAMIGLDAVRAVGANIAAQGAILCAALSYAFAAVFGRRFRRLGVSPAVTAAGQVTASSLLLAGPTLVIDMPWRLPAPDLPAIAAILALGLFSTALAYVLYFRILSHAGATRISLVTFLIPIWAILLGVVFLGEALRWNHVAGMAVILLGLLILEGGRIRTPARRARERVRVR